MSFLLDSELITYYPKAQHMTQSDRTSFLVKANGYAFGKIGGVPPFSKNLPQENLKAAVAMAFEILAEGQQATVNHVNGNITEAAPTGFYVRKADNPLTVVDAMLQPYADAFKAVNTQQADNGVLFL